MPPKRYIFIITLLEKFSIPDKYLFICTRWEKQFCFWIPFSLQNRVSVSSVLVYCPLGYLSVITNHLHALAEVQTVSTWAVWASALVVAEAVPLLPFSVSFPRDKYNVLSFLLHVFFPTPKTLLCVILVD